MFTRNEHKLGIEKVGIQLLLAQVIHKVNRIPRSVFEYHFHCECKTKLKISLIYVKERNFKKDQKIICSKNKPE